MLTSDNVLAVLFDGQFEQAPQAPPRRFITDCHIRRARNAAAVTTINMAKMSCISN